MLDASRYELPERPNISDYDSASSLAAAMQSWQKQVEREWNLLIRDAERESVRPFSVTGFNAQVRAIVLVLVVLAIIIIPVLALLKGVPITEFTQVIAPVTGIGGVIIGYWFGQTREDSSGGHKDQETS